ncbi:MAG: ATP-binding protein [Planctomycetota bacterium]
MTDKETLESCRRFVMNALKGSKFSDKDKRYIVLAVDEALAHICDYSLGMGDPHEVGLELQVDDVRFVARICDSRTDFTGLVSSDAREEAWRDMAGKRQLGLFLIRQIVDEVRYSFRRGFENELTLLKFVP